MSQGKLQSEPSESLSESILELPGFVSLHGERRSRRKVASMKGRELKVDLSQVVIDMSDQPLPPLVRRAIKITRNFFTPSI